MPLWEMCDRAPYMALMAHLVSPISPGKTPIDQTSPTCLGWNPPLHCNVMCANIARVGCLEMVEHYSSGRGKKNLLEFLSLLIKTFGLLQFLFHSARPSGRSESGYWCVCLCVSFFVSLSHPIYFLWWMSYSANIPGTLNIITNSGPHIKWPLGGMIRGAPDPPNFEGINDNVQEYKGNIFLYCVEWSKPSSDTALLYTSLSLGHILS